MKNGICVSVTELAVGDVVQFYGARFEIISTGESRGHIDGRHAYMPGDFIGPSPVARPVGRWLDGVIESGYFGPEKDWIFQGNRLARVWIEQ